jgi:hypothetical protein
MMRADAGETLRGAVPVDSGATRSYLSLKDAEQLGIEDTLRSMPNPLEALGAELECFSTSAEVEARIWLASKGQYWSDWVSLSPVFGAPQDRVFGLSDFFRHFRITFESFREPPIVCLERIN